LTFSKEGVNFESIINLILYKMYTKRNCHECGNALNGRSDKRFCSDICRNVYHNRERIAQTETIREVNLILSRNRRILMHCLEGRSAKVPSSYLSARGFDFNYFTHQISDPTGEVTVFCYELGYQKLGNDKVSVQRDAGFMRMLA
jgi:hypothetical protein